MARPRFARLASLAFVALLLAAGPARSDTGWTPDSIPWQTQAANGTRYALLEGDRRSAAAPFSYAFSIPAGVWDSPHNHSATARVFVVRGILRVGFGEHFDKSQARAYPAGSYLVVPAGAVNFDGSDIDTLIIGTATGPWSTTYRDVSRPASTGTPLPHR
jgi:hypothetical protein